jgi:mono/diheme cytochrome c family protein
LTKLSGRPDAEIRKILQNGKGRMPAQASYLDEEQMTAVIAYAKQLGAGTGARK